MFMYLKKIDRTAVFARLQFLLTEKGVSEPAYQKKHELSSQTWNNWKNRGLPLELLYAVALEFGVSMEWLVTGNVVNEAAENYKAIPKNEKEKLALRLVNSIVGRLQDDWLADGEKKAELCQDIISSANKPSD
jgi:Bacteriophage CI repressor helix-turn-helix domain